MSSKTQQPSSYFLVLLLLLANLFHLSYGDLGTAAHYSAPYLPSTCYGNDASEYPSNNLFAAAGDGVWDNGAACGREYLLRCISAVKPGTCNPDKIITIKIVDYAGSSVSRPSKNDATIILSDTAFSQIAKPSASFVNIEYRQI